MGFDRNDDDQRDRRRRFLGSAGAMLGAAGMAAVVPPSSAAAAPVGFGKDLKDDFGAVGNGTADDTAAVQRAIDSLAGNPADEDGGISGGYLFVPAGDYRITHTIRLHRFAGIIQGEGRGNQPNVGSRGLSAGRGAGFFWDGPADKPMVQVTDSAFVTFRDLMFLGNDTRRPSAGIDFHAAKQHTRGANSMVLVEDCLFGVYTWTPRGNHVGNLRNGITFTYSGDAAEVGNNDEFRIVRCQFEGGASSGTDRPPTFPDSVGIRIDHPQSIWGSVIDCRFNRMGTGFRSAASSLLVNPQFNSCDLDIEATSTANLQVDSYRSEHAAKLCKVAPSAGVVLDGGTVQVNLARMGTFGSSNAAAGRGRLVDAVPSAGNQSVVLRNLKFGYSRPDPPDRWRWHHESVLPGIVVGTTGWTSGSGFVLKVENCTDLSSRQVDLERLTGGSSKRGIIEWMSRHPNGIDQFRNELRDTDGEGWRSTIDRNVWDPPLPGTS